MKLILSTLALGTAAASPFVQHEGPTRVESAAEPTSLVTVALESDATPAAPGDEELKRTAAELEAQLADLRAELQGMRARLAGEETSGRRRVDAERATGTRARRPVARDREEEARRRAIVRRTRAVNDEALREVAEAERRGVIVRVLENAEGRQGSIMVPEGDGQRVIQLDGDHDFNETLELHDDGDLAERIAELHGAAETAWAIAVDRGEPRKVVTRRWRFAPRSEGPGEEHELHVLRGPGGPPQTEQGVLWHGSGGQTIHITVEKGDLHISADGVRSRAGEADPSHRNPRRASRARENKKNAEARARRIERKKQDPPGKTRKKTRALKKKAAPKKARRKSGVSKKGKKEAPRKARERRGEPKTTKEKNGALKKAKGKNGASKKGKKEAPRKAKERKDGSKKPKGKKTKERFSLLGAGDAEVLLAKPEIHGTIVHGFSGARAVASLPPAPSSSAR